MSCTISPIKYFAEINCPASFAKILAKTNIFRKINCIQNVINARLGGFKCSWWKFYIYYYTGKNFAWFPCRFLNVVYKTWFCQSLLNKFWFGHCLFIFVFNTYSVIQKKVILTELNLQYLTNGLTTLVKIKGALVSPNGKTVKTKNFMLPSNTQGKPRNFSWGSKISIWWYPFFRSNLNRYTFLTSK